MKPINFDLVQPKAVPRKKQPHELKRVVMYSSENPCYSGPVQSVVLASLNSRLAAIPFLEEYDYLKKEVKIQVSRFVSEFFRISKDFGNVVDPAFVEMCKVRDKELFRLQTAIMEQDEGSVFTVVVNGKHILEAEQLKYYPTKFHLIASQPINDEFDDSIIVDIFHANQRPKLYRFLMIMMFKIAVIMKRIEIENNAIFQDLQSLAGILKEFAGLYNYYNPDEEEWFKQELQTFVLLADPNDWIDDDDLREPIRKFEILCPKSEFEQRIMEIRKGSFSPNLDRPSQETIERVNKNMDELFFLIKHSYSIEKKKLLRQRLTQEERDWQTPTFLKQFVKALVSSERYRQSKFDPDKDSYLSLSGDSATIPLLKGVEGGRSSLIKSIFETDPFVGDEVDSVIGYESHYNKEPIPGSKLPWVLTIHIANPGKFKTRAIHLALSAIQDRCCYMHNRLAYLLSLLPNDCTKEQTRGTDFLRKITDPDYRIEPYSILAYDWSNATDRLLQEFQERCLRLVFPEEVVQFWHKVSSCKKTFRFKGKFEKTYNQANGQPQGLLASFEAFALAHHIMMLYTMYVSERDEIEASDFYRVLGDDSVLTSVTSDPTNEVGETYCEVCHWANVKINRSKSTEILSGQGNALVEFAKVYVYNGEFFSPVPFRLATRCGDPKGDYYAFAASFWMQTHGGHQKPWISLLIDRYYQDEVDNKIVRDLLFSGNIPWYREMGPEFNEIPRSLDPESLLALLGYYFSSIRSSFAFALLGDKSKEEFGRKQIDKEVDGLSALIPENLDNYLDYLEDMDHKIMRAIQKNLDKEDLIKYFLEDASNDQANVLAAKLNLPNEFYTKLQGLVSLIEIVSENPDSVELYRPRIIEASEVIDELGNLNYRSLYKRVTRDCMTFKNAVSTTRKLFSGYSKYSE